MSVPLHTALPSVNWGSVLLSFGAPNVKKKVAPFRFGPDAPPVLVDNPLDNSQTHAGPFEVFRAVQPLEDAE